MTARQPSRNHVRQTNIDGRSGELPILGQVCRMLISAVGSRPAIMGLVLTSGGVAIQQALMGSSTMAIGLVIASTVILVREANVNGRSQRMLDSVLDAATEIAVVAADIDGRFTIFNKGAESMLGYRSDEMIDVRRLDELHDLEEITAEAKACGVATGADALLHHAKNGKPVTRDWTYLHKDGRPLTVSLMITAIRTQAGKIIGFLGIATDVTAKREQEREQERLLWLERELTQSLACQNDELVRMDRTKDEFVATVSHEFRTPLTSIRGYLETLLDGDAGQLTETQTRFLRTIERNSERLGNLVEDLLYAARIDAGGTSVAVLAEIDLTELVMESIESAHPLAKSKNIDLCWETSEGLMVAVDPARMSQLLDNLTNNAIKFTPNGGRVSLKTTSDGDSAVITVTDTGIGIPLDEQSRLFRRFFRSRLASEHAISGTGIGLAIVKEIADAHGATIEVESTPGVGTTFSVAVPLLVRLAVL